MYPAHEWLVASVHFQRYLRLQAVTPEMAFAYEKTEQETFLVIR